jgi:hypothetical protein
MELVERVSLYRLAEQLKRAGWTVETVEGLPYVRDEEGEPVGLLDDELMASLARFFGVPRASA